MVEGPRRPGILWPTSAAPLTMDSPPVEGVVRRKYFGHNVRVPLLVWRVYNYCSCAHKQYRGAKGKTPVTTAWRECHWGLLLCSHELIATMQSVVTGQAPITLERKITSGGKQIKTEDNTHNNWNKSYTSDKNKKKVRSVYVSRYIPGYHMYVC